MTFRKVSVLCPTRKRISYLERMLKSFEETTRDHRDQVEMIFRIDFDDVESMKYLSARGYEFLVGPRLQGYRSLPQFYNEMARVSRGDVIICGNDDLVYRTPGWVEKVLAHANRYPDGIFNFGAETGLNPDKFPFSIVSRKVVDAIGFINDERLLFSDVFLLDVMNAFERSIRIYDVELFHDWAGHNADETRRDANKHEFEMVFADATGRWTDEYDRKHRQAVSEAVQRIEKISDIRVEAVLSNLKAISSGTTHSDRDQLPAWLDTRAIGQIDPVVARSLVSTVMDSSEPSSKIFVSEFGRGTASWILRSTGRSVVAVSEGSPQIESATTTKESIVVEKGQVWNTRFMTQLAQSMSGSVTCGLIIENNYARMISPYSHFKKTIRAKGRGSMIFLRPLALGEDVRGADSFQNFIDDLSTGKFDGQPRRLQSIVSSEGAVVGYVERIEPTQQ